MHRRSFVNFATIALLAGSLLGAAIVADRAEAADPVRLKMGSAFPGDLVQLGSLGKRLSEKVELVTGGSVQLKFFEPHALVPPLDMFDAISTGSLDAAWSTPGYWYGKEKALPLFSAVPFGPSASEYAAWIYYGGGEKLMQDIYDKHNIVSMICGVIAPEASGWFRHEIKSVEDLKGLKMRFYGLGARVMEKVGVSTQLIAGRDVYLALERGSIDATEYSMPAIDLDLRFYQVAGHYYFPGWHQQSTLFELMISKDKWKLLSKTQQEQIRIACGDNFRDGLAEGEAIQFAALNELKAKGVEMHRWPPEVLETLERAWDEVAAELSAEDKTFKKVWASLKEFRANYAIWRELGYLN